MSGLNNQMPALTTPELLEPNRNMDKILKQLGIYGLPTTSPADEPSIVNLAHRTIRTRLVDNGYLAEDEPVAFDMSGDEAVNIATTAAKYIRSERKHAKLSENFANKIRKGNKGE